LLFLSGRYELPVAEKTVFEGAIAWFSWRWTPVFEFSKRSGFTLSVIKWHFADL
jgi:hypothetical protein